MTNAAVFVFWPVARGDSPVMLGDAWGRSWGGHWPLSVMRNWWWRGR